MTAWLAWGAAATAGLIALYIGLPFAFKVFHRKKFLAEFANRDCVCLTFDDGPDPDCTPELLRVLEKHGAKATFFVIGKNAERHPEIMSAIARAGHAIGSHSYEHRFAWTTGPVRTLRDLQRGEMIVAAVNMGRDESGRALFRPPFGKLNLASLFFMRGPRRTIWWNVDPRDYEKNSGDAIAAEVVPHLRPGSVVLLHDGGDRPIESKLATVEAVDKLLSAARERGLRVGTVGGV